MTLAEHSYTVPEISDDGRYNRLLTFANEVIGICLGLGIDPLLDGSMAVRVHTEDPTIVPRDIDLNCSEEDFPRLKHALDGAGRSAQPRGLSRPHGGRSAPTATSS